RLHPPRDRGELAALEDRRSREVVQLRGTERVGDDDELEVRISLRTAPFPFGEDELRLRAPHALHLDVSDLSSPGALEIEADPVSFSARDLPATQVRPNWRPVSHGLRPLSHPVGRMGA